jgi:hypothetical protein
MSRPRLYGKEMDRFAKRARRRPKLPLSPEFFQDDRGFSFPRCVWLRILHVAIIRDPLSGGKV